MCEEGEWNEVARLLICLYKYEPGRLCRHVYDSEALVLQSCIACYEHNDITYMYTCTVPPS